MKIGFEILENEVWWGGSAELALAQPYGKDTSLTIALENTENQTSPLFLSSQGRYVWGGSPFVIRFECGRVEIEGEDIELVKAGDCLRDAYLAAMKAHFPFEDKALPERFFTTAQYNTWMEFTYDPTQEKVLKYAHAIVDNGYTPGILIIDEGWSIHYGTWEFDFVKFPDPKAMISELHELGFTVMLWVVPYVTLDGRSYLELAFPWVSRLAGKEYEPKLARTESGEVAVLKWWNGLSGMYNMCNEADREWLDRQLRHLMDDYGVDGFKFDGGNISSLTKKRWVTEPPTESPEALNKAWNDFGTRYAYHEYKDTYCRGGRATIQRLCDRRHTWDKRGLASLVPSALLQGILGYPYICPDMIGGGEWSCTLDPDFKVDEELFVRMAQCSALFPMMQFSWAPWRALTKEAQRLCSDASRLHIDFRERILALVNNARVSGEPIIRSMEYLYPHRGYERITDQFFLGDDVLVCPVVVKGETERKAILPEGSWRYVDGRVYEGECEVKVDAPIEVLPYFIKEEK